VQYDKTPGATGVIVKLSFWTPPWATVVVEQKITAPLFALNANAAPATAKMAIADNNNFALFIKPGAFMIQKAKLWVLIITPTLFLMVFGYSIIVARACKREQLLLTTC
jgi:hypothetical protein